MKENKETDIDLVNPVTQSLGINETGKKFQIIYADPPWSFKTYSAKGKEKKSADRHYSCMNINDIYNLPVSEIADDNCVLFLWVTFPLLKEGMETIKRWGFTYKTCAFNWVKKNKNADSYFMGLGYWTRSNSEICILATKGKPKRVSSSVRQLCDAKIMAHSKKPDEIRDRIVQLLGNISRIELFARQKAEGWDVWGDEVESEPNLITLHSISEIYYLNRQLSERCTYKNGKLYGEYKTWYNSGQLWEQCYYISGRLDGERKHWNGNGQLTSCNFYKKDLRFGQQIIFKTS